MGTDVYEVICDAHDSDWLARRLSGIGASEIAAVLGVSSFKSRYALYQEKIGAIEPPDLSDVERIDWGKRLEPLIIDAYQDRTGRPVRHSGKLLRSKRYPWALCTLDGETTEQPRPWWWPLEIKTTGAFMASDWVDGAPEIYDLQVHQQMLVTGAEVATVACLVGGQKLVWCDVERNEETIRRIVYHGERFWADVQERQEPPPDASASTREAMRRLYPEDNGETVVLDDEIETLVRELAELKDEKKLVEADIEEREARIKAALGEAQRGVFPASDWAVSWKAFQRKGYTVQPSVSRRFLIHAPK